jgi:ribosomal protein S5
LSLTVLSNTPMNLVAATVHTLQQVCLNCTSACFDILSVSKSQIS